MSLPRLCRDCGERFQPTSNRERLCQSCWQDAIKNKGKKKQNG